MISVYLKYLSILLNYLYESYIHFIENFVMAEKESSPTRTSSMRSYKLSENQAEGTYTLY